MKIRVINQSRDMMVLNNFVYGDRKMYIKNSLEVIKEEIEIKREKLNELVVMENRNVLVLKLSMELDSIINLYYESVTGMNYSKHIK